VYSPPNVATSSQSSSSSLSSSSSASSTTFEGLIASISQQHNIATNTNNGAVSPSARSTSSSSPSSPVGDDAPLSPPSWQRRTRAKASTTVPSLSITTSNDTLDGSESPVSPSSTSSASVTPARTPARRGGAAAARKRSNNSGSGSGVSTQQAKEAKARRHNESEWKRRQKLHALFAEVSELCETGLAANKQMKILQAAVSTLKKLRTVNSK
jgi:hypothetical protein